MWKGKFKYNLLACPVCKKQFKSPLFQKGRKFCSLNCRNLAFKGRSNYWIKGIKLSEKTKEKISKALKGRKFSKQHRKKISISRRGKRMSDETKNKLSEALKRRWKTKNKYNFIRRGEKNGNWKGGITPENVTIRTSRRLIKWRNKIFTRDNFICQFCGDNKGGNLQAHHIKLFSEAIQERFLIKNGITLCQKCHQEIHKGKRCHENPLSNLYAKKQKAIDGFFS